MSNRIQVWDLPIRLFHWLLVLAVIGLFVTGKLGGNWMEWHQRLGYFVLGLVIFRILWGIFGSFHARFVNFVRSPMTVWNYMKALGRKESPHYLGHNPMGAFSVIAMLAILGFQALSGLFADDDILLRGPYAASVSKDISDLLTKLHKWNSDLILILIGVHLLAIAFYFFVKKDNLVKPMITGEKSNIDGQFEAKMPEKARPYWLSWFIAILTVLIVVLVVNKLFWARL
jgi:cytochrome b